MKAATAGEVQRLEGRLQGLQRERDAALADASCAREEARVAAAAQEQAVAAARSAQEQLQMEVGAWQLVGARWAARGVPCKLETSLPSSLHTTLCASPPHPPALPSLQRDAVMASLAELQAAFNASEAKRAAEMRRLREAAEARGQEAAALRAEVEQREAQLARLTLLAPQLARPAAPPQPQRQMADMEADLVLQRSLASSHGGHAAVIGSHSSPRAAAPAEALPLQPVHLAARENMGPPGAAPLSPVKQEQAGVEQGGWGPGYLSQFPVGASGFSGARACAGTGHAALLHASRSPPSNTLLAPHPAAAGRGCHPEPRQRQQAGGRRRAPRLPGALAPAALLRRREQRPPAAAAGRPAPARADPEHVRTAAGVGPRAVVEG